jgi:hypothetical protein
MGVGAIFISTLAKYRLPEPTSPPETPQDILATALHPVVGFVVLVSIAVRKSTHPCYTFIVCMKESCVDGLSITIFAAMKRMRDQTRQSSDSLATFKFNEDGATATAQP